MFLFVCCTEIMSLFNAIDLWNTRCGENDLYSFHSIFILDAEGCENSKIFVGSLNGILRVYQIAFNEPEKVWFKPSDLLLEVQLPSNIIQITFGKLVSGSRSPHLCIVHPGSISVYSFMVTSGSTEHGSQLDLKIVYEQPLLHMNYQVIVGPFGGVTGRDFICSLAVDGTLCFFEQETFVFETQLPDFLIPFPITYVAEYDMFVTLSADWRIEAYSYHSLVKSVKKKVMSIWSYNLGEPLLDIQTAQSNNKEEAVIVALSERNITCLNSKGLLKFVKRLQFTPVCFHPYFIDGSHNLMILIVSDVGTLLIYDECTLRWSVKLPIVPICIFRTKLGVEGSLLLFSDIGELNYCFLGTNPSFFSTPFMESSLLNYKNVTQKLKSLQEEIRNYQAKNDNNLPLKCNGQEISATLKTLPYDLSLERCQLIVEVTPSRPLSNVHIRIEYQEPLDIQPSSHFICSLHGKTVLNSYAQIGGNKAMVVSSIDVTAVICYVDENVPRLIRRHATISARLVLIPSTVTDEECTFQLNIQTNRAPPLLTTLFQEFRNDRWPENGCGGDTVGFCLNYDSSKKCVISSLKDRFGFSIASNSLSFAYLALTQLVMRCKTLKHFADKNVDDIKFEYYDKIPKDVLLDAVVAHMQIRSKIIMQKKSLEKLSTQFRLIQRRLLAKLKDKIPSTLSSIQLLYHSTYDRLIETIKNVEADEKELLMKNYHLQVALNLIFDLMLMIKEIIPDHVRKLKSAMHLTALNSDNQGWSERTAANVTYLLRSTLSVCSRDQHTISAVPDKLIIDASELTDLIETAINRILGTSYVSEKYGSRSTLKEQGRVVSPILELDESEDVSIQEKGFKYRNNTTVY